VTIELITGTPGSGKTTYAVAERLASEAQRVLSLEFNGQPVEVSRRLLVAGIGGLLVEHEKLPHTLTGDTVSQKVIDYFNAVDDDGELVHKRLRGDPPVVVPEEIVIGGKVYAAGPSLFNWWLWCEPGDLIAVDEVQYIVPRGAVGKKPPAYIALLEVHRHYGIDFLFITQHPQLLDTTIRNLVGMHRHIRPVMSSALCMVYVWDHASNPERFSLATKSQFLRKKAHYRLFKSAAAHVKPPSSGRAVLWVLPLLLCFAAFLGWRVLGSQSKASSHLAVAAVPSSQVASGAGAPLGLGSLASSTGEHKSAQSTDRTWPVYVAEPVKLAREPLDGRAVQWEGGYSYGHHDVAYFGLFVDGERVATLTLADLAAMGYSWTTWGPCVGSLRYRAVERLVTCGKRAYAPPAIGTTVAPAVPVPEQSTGAPA
jgi:zona occludens toxin